MKNNLLSITIQKCTEGAILVQVFPSNAMSFDKPYSVKINASFSLLYFLDSQLLYLAIKVLKFRLQVFYCSISNIIHSIFKSDSEQLV